MTGCVGVDVAAGFKFGDAGLEVIVFIAEHLDVIVNRVLVGDGDLLFGLLRLNGSDGKVGVTRVLAAMDARVVDVVGAVVKDGSRAADTGNVVLDLLLLLASGSASGFVDTAAFIPVSAPGDCLSPLLETWAVVDYVLIVLAVALMQRFTQAAVLFVKVVDLL